MLRLVFCGALFLLLLAAACSGDSEASPPSQGSVATRASSAAEATRAHGEATTTSVVTLNIEGMTCEACEGAIRKAVERIDGVRSCTVSHKEKVARIELEPGKKVDESLLAKAITDLGYQVVGEAKVH